MENLLFSHFNSYFFKKRNMGTIDVHIIMVIDTEVTGIVTLDQSGPPSLTAFSSGHISFTFLKIFFLYFYPLLISH